MTMARKIKMLLAARDMSISDLSKTLTPQTTLQNVASKLRRDNLTEDDMRRIAEACNATFEGGFVLNDTGEKI